MHGPGLAARPAPDPRPAARATRKITSISSWPLKRALFSSTHLSHTGLPATRWNSVSCAAVYVTGFSFARSIGRFFLSIAS